MSFFAFFSSSTAAAASTFRFPYSVALSPRNSMPRFSSLASSQTLPSPEPEPKPKPKPKPWLLVGLGNPGKKYQSTRHNVGFEMIDAIADAEGISVSSIQFKALFGKGFIANVPVMLAKPQTFMNASGESMYDDMDLPFATLRLLPKGGHGGHNGMRSVIDRLKGSREFPRLRIGIGRPPGKMDPVNFVLRPFNRQEREELDFTFQNGLEAIRILLLEGFDKSATFVNSSKSMKVRN
ncbi:hypothetical protein AAC387_Pa05g3139 [Persea americana]